jgi:hypothetical protein
MNINPRIAAGLTSEQWDRKRRLERRREWENRAAQHDTSGAPVRDRAEHNPELARWRTGSCLDPDVPLGSLSPFYRIESGMNLRAYYHAKFMRLGTLGEFGPLNPFLREAQQLWEKERRRETH